MKLSDYIVTFLQKKGIRHFFGYQGTMIAHLVDSIERNPETENHSGYNEQGAAFAACGYAQAKEECACAYATSGPGAINLLSGVADAYYDSLPVIFLTGQLNTYEYSGIKGLRQQGFQETDIVAMAKPITKYAVQIRNPEDIVEELNKAYHIATTGRRGPVLIDLPMNIQRSEVENPVYDMTFEDKHTDAAAAQQAADTILEALEQAKRPVIMLGHGVDSSFSQQKLIRFAQKRQIPIITSVLAKSVLGYDHPLNFGCIGGAYGHRYANMIANKPKERKAMLIANANIKAKIQEQGLNPNITEDKKEIKKISSVEMQRARDSVGASGRRSKVTFTDKEWEAVQAGAISDNMLTKFLNSSDSDEIVKRAMPKNATVMTSAKMSKASAKLRSGYSYAEIAKACGVPESTVYSALNK